jgi:uncharacterized integral membrane protein
MRNDAIYTEDFVPSNIDELKYQSALKRVKRIKGFYTHLIVFIVINILILVLKIQKSNSDYFTLRNFSTAIFWGIGLVSHGLSVFLPSFILGQDWEEKKIKEFMEKGKNNKWE